MWSLKSHSLTRCPQCGSENLLHAYDEQYHCLNCDWFTIRPPVRIVYRYDAEEVERWVYVKKG